MKVFQTENLRNVGLVSHGGAGTTSLAESLLYNVGLTDRVGKVDDETSSLDYLPEEKKRHMSVFLSMAPIEWKGCKINLIDTPGYADFRSEVHCCLRAVDALVFTVCAVSGVQVQTELIWEDADALNLPRMVYVNKMDRDHADFYRVLADLRHRFTKKRLVPLQFPIGAGEDFEGIIDLLTMKAIRWDRKNLSWKELEIPAEYSESIKKHHLELVEAAAEGDDDLLMRYLDGEDLTTDDLLSGLQKAARKGEVVPILCGSASENIATAPLLNKITDYFPSPVDSMKTTSVESGLSTDPFSGIVFKTISDNFIGKISFVRIATGTLKKDSLIYNPAKDAEEKVPRLYTILGKELQEIEEARAGDIVCLTKLSKTVTGDSLCTKDQVRELEPIRFPKPNYAQGIRPKSKDDEDKLWPAFDKLTEEDPSIEVKRNKETRQTTVNGLGTMHIDVLVSRLERKFGVEVELSDPIIPYRETITQPVHKVEGKHKKQSGGHGQYGHVYIDVEPLMTGDFVFEETIFGGSVPKNYIPAVEKGILEAMEYGVLAGYPMTRIKAILRDGSYHSVDSSEMAFKMAGSLAIKAAVQKASPVLLEPIVRLDITVPEAYMGDIMGDINTKRGKILGMEAKGKKQVISALAPLAEMSKYTIDLKALTQGKGRFTMAFDSYDIVPSHLVAAIVDAKKKDDEAASKE